MNGVSNTHMRSPIEVWMSNHLYTRTHRHRSHICTLSTIAQTKLSFTRILRRRSLTWSRYIRTVRTLAYSIYATPKSSTQTVASASVSLSLRKAASLTHIHCRWYWYYWATHNIGNFGWQQNTKNPVRRTERVPHNKSNYSLQSESSFIVDNTLHWLFSRSIRTQLIQFYSSKIIGELHLIEVSIIKNCFQ